MSSFGLSALNLARGHMMHGHKHNRAFGTLTAGAKSALLQTGVAVATSVALGALQRSPIKGTNRMVDIGPVPVDLGLGIAATLASAFIPEKMGSVANAVAGVGTGALCFWGGYAGTQLYDMVAGAPALPTGTVPTGVKGRPLPPAQPRATASNPGSIWSRYGL